MKKNIILILLLIFFKETNAQLIKKMSNGIDRPIITNCKNSISGITVIYNKFKDTFYVENWNPATQNWEFINKFKGLTNSKNYSCTYLKDTLYVYGSVNNVVGVHKINEFEITTVGEFDKLNTEAPLMLVFGNEMLFCSNFDTIYYNSSSVTSNSVALYNGLKWKGLNKPFTANTLMAYKIIGSKNSDSALIAFPNFANNYSLLGFVYPDFWYPISSITSDVNQIGVHENKFILSKKFQDSIIYYSNFARVKSISPYSGITPDFEYSNPLINYKEQLFTINKNGKISYLLGNRFIETLTLPNYSNDPTWDLIASDTLLYATTQTPFYYQNEDIKHAFEINTNELSNIKTDTIYGFVFIDNNQNGIFDGNDSFPNQISQIFNKTYQKLINTRLNGSFEEYVPDYNDVEFQFLNTNFDSCSSISFSANLISKNTNNKVSKDSIYFPIRPFNSKSLYRIKIEPYARYQQRLLDPNKMLIKVSSKKCKAQITPTKITLKLKLANNYQFTSSNIPYTNFSNNELTFKIDLLDTQLLEINGYYPNTYFSINDKVKHHISYSVYDTTELHDFIEQLLVYSYDPNIKNCTPEGRVYSSLNKIRYYIQFQNEGNDVARKVIVIDTLNLKIPVYEFQMVGASHPYSVAIRDNIVKWEFDDINLKPKSENEELSKGYVAFEAKIKGELGIGDSILNKAYIYFDYNPPIITDDSKVIRLTDSSKNSKTIKTLYLYPNPARSQITFKNTSNKSTKVSIYDAKGAEIESIELNSNTEKKVNVTNWSAGIYIARNEKGESYKFIIY